MGLKSIDNASQNGTFELSAIQSKDLPGLTNSANQSVTLSITSNGLWSLLTPDFETSDTELAKYKIAVDGDGYPANKAFNWKYPNTNPGALVAEIKDPQGNTRTTVSGKNQSFELQPGESVTFIINDDPKYFGNNAGKLEIGYSIVPKVAPSNEPQPIADLYNTGVDNTRNALGDSVVDPHYTLTSSPSGTVTPAVTTPRSSIAGTWVANSATSRWIGPNTASAVGPIGDYTYKTTFTLPSFLAASIVGTLSVDDQIIDILINGVSAGNTVPFGSWTTVSKFTISSGFVVGLNTIEFKLNTVGGPTGLRVDSIAGT